MQNYLSTPHSSSEWGTKSENPPKLNLQTMALLFTMPLIELPQLQPVYLPFNYTGVFCVPPVLGIGINPKDINVMIS